MPRRRILWLSSRSCSKGPFAALLGDGEQSDVVQFHRAGPEELSAHYDVAIVTTGLADEVEPGVLITLPDTDTRGGEASITVDGVTRAVRARTNQDVIDLLSEHFSPELRAHRSA